MQCQPLTAASPNSRLLHRASEEAARSCLAAYRAALTAGAPASAAVASAGALPGWPRRPPGLGASYVATCYTLLHELGPLHDVAKRRPELWEAPSLAAVQAAVWGWLDAAL